jgi:glycine cleavage system transcriptional repressor
MAQVEETKGQWLMLTVVGADRPGIVAQLTDALFRAGCNLGEASMARLGGNFTIMLMVEGAESGALEGVLRPVTQELGLRLHIDSIHGELHHHQEPNVQVTVHGADRPGIVAQVTAALSRTGFNILDLNSNVGGNRAQPIYVMIIDGIAPAGAAAVERELAPLRTKGVEVRVSALDTLLG